MKTQIRDRAALASLSSIDVRAYLAAQGWREAGRIGDKASIFEFTDHTGRGWEVLLPTRTTLADYAERMADVISTLAQAESREQVQIYTDLTTSGADVVRLRAPDTDHGSISVENGVALHQETENLLLAAACSTAKPGRTAYHAPKIVEATDYLKSVRFGIPERGSYILTVLSPVDPALKRQATFGPEFEDDPFSRQVTRRLATALSATRDAVTEATATDDFAAFERAVGRGLNANLCEALAGLAQHGRGLDVRLSWARVRPAPETSSSWTFNVDAARVLEEAARKFRRTEAFYGEEVVGVVERPMLVRM